MRADCKVRARRGRGRKQKTRRKHEHLLCGARGEPAERAAGEARVVAADGDVAAELELHLELHAAMLHRVHPAREHMTACDLPYLLDDTSD